MHDPSLNFKEWRFSGNLHLRVREAKKAKSRPCSRRNSRRRSRSVYKIRCQRLQVATVGPLLCGRHGTILQLRPTFRVRHPRRDDDSRTNLFTIILRERGPDIKTSGLTLCRTNVFNPGFYVPGRKMNNQGRTMKPLIRAGPRPFISFFMCPMWELPRGTVCLRSARSWRRNKNSPVQQPEVAS